MKVLVVGSGAREHALCWALSRSPRLATLFCAPGNAGTESLAAQLPVRLEAVDDLVEAAVGHGVDLVVVGPEAPLAAGLVDRLAERGVPAFGPTAGAARLEWSKAWTKELLLRLGVPTARAAVATSLAEGRRALDRFDLPVVVKADGLAAGKGVTIARSRAEAEAALRNALEARAFGPAGEIVVVEEYLEGRELSVLAFCDGQTLAMMPAARDYKAVFDGDRGPNTGGMGAYSRPAFATAPLLDLVESQILRPVVDEMARAGAPFRGALYAGLMVTRGGPMLLEFNCRFGDPETQVILPLLDVDLLDVLDAVARGALRRESVCWRPGSACGVVLASGGYPGSYLTGFRIDGLDTVPPDALVFHAGTARDATGAVVTAGGRVLTVVALGESPAAARVRAYEAARRIRFSGRHMRTDIAADDGPLPFDPAPAGRPGGSRA